jgi:alanine dehydrogenase
MTISHNNPKQINYEGSLMPQVEMLSIGNNNKKLKIGLPKEENKYENRIMLTPFAVKQLIDEGHNILMESGAGEKSNWSDADYTSVGAKIASKSDVYKSEIVAKVSPFSENEISLLGTNQTIFSALHVNTQSENSIRKLLSKKVTAIAIENIKDKNGFAPFVESMSEISGILSISTASEYLSNAKGGKGIVLGGITGIPPAKVVILGASKSGEYAARAAIALGAQVKIFDKSIEKLQKIKSKLGFSIYTSVLQKDAVAKNIKSADVVIGAIDFSGNDEGFVVAESDIAKMKKGAVIIDLNIDNFSCFATSHLTNLGNPTFVKHGVTHYCVPNIASRASRTASLALSNALFTILLNISENSSGIYFAVNDAALRNGTYIYMGILTNKQLAKKFNLDYKDIDLLTAIF